MAEVLRLLPKDTHPDLLVGLDASDDAGVLMLPSGEGLVQTVDFFTPIVDDPYAFGAIAAANAFSDVYAMGGRPLSVLNIACFSPSAAPPEVWANILKGAFDKTLEAGATVLGGHSVEDSEPKFGMAVTGLVDPERVLAIDRAEPGDVIYLTKPLGTGIVTTAMKFDLANQAEAEAAIASMLQLNAEAAEAAAEVGARCATDITGFGLGGHLFNVARASRVEIEIWAEALPLLPGVERLIEAKALTGGAAANEAWVGERFSRASNVPEWLDQVVWDPQTSGGLAIFAKREPRLGTPIGRVREGSPGIRFERPRVG